MGVPERCLRCDWWNFSRQACDRVFKAKLRVGPDAGEIFIETLPGVLPKDMEDDFTGWLVTVMGDIIDAWPGWKEIKRLRDGGKPCAGEQPSAAIQKFGQKLSLVKPLHTPQPELNLDAHGLFKADISLW
jgi:hypothetical protein